MKPNRVLGLLLLCSVSAAFAQDAVLIAERAPKDSALVIAWSGADQAQPAFDASLLGKFWAQPSVQAFVRAPLASSWSILKQKLAQDASEEELDLIEQIGGVLWHRPGMVCMFPIKPGKSDPAVIGLAVEWEIGSEGRELSERIEALVKKRLGADAKVLKLGKTVFRRVTKDWPVYLAVRKKHWILAIGKGSAKKMLEARTGEASFARNACHQRALKAMGKMSPWYYQVVDVASLRKALIETISGLSGEDDQKLEAPGSSLKAVGAAAAAVLAEMILVSDAATIGSAEFALAYEFDGAHLRKSAYAKADEEHPIACDFAGCKPLDLQRLRDIPKDAVSGQVFTVDAATAYSQTLRTIEYYTDLFKKNAPGDKAPPLDLAAKVRDQLGMDIEKDFLAHLGDHLIWFSGGTAAKSYLLGSIDVRDRAAVASFVESVITKLPREAAVEKQEGEGRTAYVIPFRKLGLPAPGAVCFVLTGDRLIFSTDLDAVGRFTTHLGATVDERETIADRPAVKEFLKQHKSERISWIRWENEADGLSLVYASLTTLYGMAAGAKNAVGLPIELAQLPPQAAFTPYCDETVSWMAVDGSVRVWRDVSGLGFGSALSSVSKMSLGIAAALPSLARARELSKRTVCAANLSGIGKAMYIYASDHEGQFPPDFETLLKDGTIGPKHFLCPTSTAKAGDLHACYEYIPGQTTSGDLRNVLIYEINQPHLNEGANLLFRDGHVEFVKPYSKAMELVEETKARLEQQQAEKRDKE